MMFQELHNAKVLYPIIARLIDSEYIAGDSEFATRGLYCKTVNWKSKTINNRIESITIKYLVFNIKIINLQRNGKMESMLFLI